MKLTVEERILLFQLLPQKHNYQTLKQLIDLRNEIKFSEEETRKFDIYSSFPTEIKCKDCDIVFNNEGGVVASALDGKYTCPKCGSAGQTEVLREDHSRSQITYNKEVATGHTKDIKPKVYAKAALTEILENMSKQKNLTEQYLSLYEKFV